MTATTQQAQSIAGNDAADALPLGFKQTELGVMPNDWEVYTCADVCIKIQDGTHFSPKLGGTDYLYVTSRNVRFGHLDVFDAERISELEHRKIYSRCDTRRGDLLLTKDGANTGNAAINHLDEECSLLSSVAFLRFDISNHDPRFYLQYILSAEGQQRIKEMMSGNAITRLTLAKIQQLRVPSPLLPEQRVIAEALSDVDGLLGALEALIAKKRAIKQAAMQQLLTGKTRLPGFSGEWETRRLGDIASIRNQKVLPSNVDPDTACVELEHVGQGDGRLLESSTARYSTSSKYRFFGGDVLFGRLRPYLRKFWLADRDGICTTEIWPLMVDPDKADGGFLQAIVQSDRFIEAASVSYGTHMPRADWGVMRNCEVHLPPIDEQTAIATVLSDMDAEIAALERRRDKTRAIKQGMMQQLLTGRVRLVKPQRTEATA